MYHFVVSLVRIGLHFWYNIKFEGKENIPKDRCCVFVSNHRTNADPPLVVLGVKRKFGFMAKEELFQNKLFGFIIKSVGAFPVARGKGDTSAIDNSLKTLKNGQNLVIFPEGTRSKDGKLGRGKTGAALISATAGVDVLPVGIIFEGQKLKFRHKIIVRYGQPINTAKYLDENGQPILRNMAKLKNEYMSAIKTLIGQDEIEVKEVDKI